MKKIFFLFAIFCTSVFYSQDSSLVQESKKEKIKAQLKYEYERRIAEDSIKYAEQQEIRDIELEKQNQLLRSEKSKRNSLAFGIIALVVFFILATALAIVIVFVKLSRRKKPNL